MEILLFVVAVIWMVFAIIQDLKSREVANWINFSLIIFALTIRGFYSIFTENYYFILWGFIGLGVGFVLAHLFYYSRAFAGGDAKLLIGLFVIIPIASDWYGNVLIFFIYTISFMALGAVYSLIYSFFIISKRYKEFRNDFLIRVKNSKIYFYISVIFAFIFFVFGFFVSLFFVFSIFSVLLYLLFFYLKSVEEVCLKEYVETNKLTIGDWIVEPVKIGKKVIKPNWEGLSEEELKLIQSRYKKKVLVKYGIPFTPSFLLGFLVILFIKYFLASNWGLI